MNHLELASKEDVGKVFSVCKQNKSLRNIYRHHKQGWSNDKGRTMKHESSIPVSFLFHPEYKKYFDIQQDRHELKKSIEKFLRLFPEFDLRKT